MKGVSCPGLLPMLLLCVAAQAADPETQAQRHLDPSSDLVGELSLVTTRHEDTLIDIARKHGLGYHAIRNANPGVDPWVPGEGTDVVLPRRHVLPGAHRSGLVINLPEMRLYDFTAGPGRLMTYPVSIGRMDWNTPLGTLSVIEKTERPSWHPPASIRKAYAERGETLPARIPPGPDNPLGEYAMRLSRPSYLIHGTNWPEGIGLRATHGCIRLGPQDIEHLFSRIPLGTRVHIVNEPVKAGWSGDTLYLEAHPFLEELQEPNNLTPAVRAVVAATRTRPARVDWGRVREVAEARAGIPVPVGSHDLQATVVDQRRSEAPVVAPNVGTGGGEWFVQLGVFGYADNARRLELRLKEAGFEVHLHDIKADGRAMVRVVVGPVGDSDAAGALRDAIHQALGDAGRVVNLNLRASNGGGTL